MLTYPYMWPFTRSTPRTTSSPVFFTNTLSGKKEQFIPLKPGHASMYSCGPTVYSQAHIGNMRTYVFADTVARVLTEAGYRVRRVINITDVGHLVGDGDEGEDKMEVGSKTEGIRAEDIAAKYARMAISDMGQLGIDTEQVLFPRATQYVKEQIAYIEELEKKGVTYRISDGIYFDTSRFPDYGRLGGVKETLKAGSAETLLARVAETTQGRIKKNEEKRNPADFALWKFSSLGVRRQQEWTSPWGRGFPGWHIECSAMSKALLGTEIDVHTGGIDLIPVHHNNEIAQSEMLTGRPFVKYWMHAAFLNIGEDKISKSLGNTVCLSDVVAEGIHPLALRYFFLQAHYRSSLSFSWEALHASQEALTRLWRLARSVKEDAKGMAAPSPLRDRMVTLLRDDLATPAALALLWEVLKDEDISIKVQYGVLEAAEAVLGLSLLTPPAPAEKLSIADLPPEVRALVSERQAARAHRDFTKADELRIHIEKRGYAVDDGPEGPRITKI